MNVKDELHRLVDQMDDLQTAVAHDYLIWWLSRDQEIELTPEEQAAVDHDYQLWLASHDQEEELTPEERAAVEHDVALIRSWEEAGWGQSASEDDSLVDELDIVDTGIGGTSDGSKNGHVRRQETDDDPFQ